MEISPEQSELIRSCMETAAEHCYDTSSEASDELPDDDGNENSNKAPAKPPADTSLKSEEDSDSSDSTVSYHSDILMVNLIIYAFTLTIFNNVTNV